VGKGSPQASRAHACFYIWPRGLGALRAP